MVNIEFTTGASTFTINNITLVRNFHSYVSGNKLRIVNAYDTRNQLLPYTLFSDISVNGVVSGSVVELAEILAPILFQKKEGSDTGGVVTLSGNIITKVVPVQINWTQDSVQQVVNYVNSREFVVLGTQRILFKGIRIIGDVETSNAVESYFWEFKPGKGNYGVNGTPITSADIEYTSFVTNYQNNLIILGEIGTDPIEVFVNDSGPYGINSASLNVFKTLRQGNPVNYIYIGNSNNIGSGQTQTIAEDYIDVNATPVNPPASTGGLDVPLEDGLIPVSRADGSIVWEPKPTSSTSTSNSLFTIEAYSSGYSGGLIYRPFAKFSYEGTAFSVSEEFTLVTNDIPAGEKRNAAIVLNSNGAITLVYGESDVNPPDVDTDPVTQYKAAQILLSSGAAAPDGVNLKPIYTNNAGTPSEWNAAIVKGAGWDLAFDDGGNTKIKGTNLQQGDRLLFTPDAPILVGEFTELTFNITNLTALSSAATLRFLVHGNTSSKGNGTNTIYLPEFPNYDPASLEEQFISITIPALSLHNIRNLQLWKGGIDPVSILIDNIKYNDGSQPSGENFATVGFVNAQDAATLQSAKDYADQLAGGDSGSTVKARYADIAALLAAQSSQIDKGVYFVANASGDPTVDSGWAYYEYKATTTGTLADYRKLSEEESQDITLPTAAETKTALEGIGAFTISAALKAKLEAMNLPPLPVSASRQLAITDKWRKLYITANVTLTYPAGGLGAEFEFNAVTTASGQAQFADQNSGNDLEAPDGTILEGNKMGHFFVNPSGKLEMRGGFKV